MRRIDQTDRKRTKGESKKIRNRVAWNQFAG